MLEQTMAILASMVVVARNLLVVAVVVVVSRPGWSGLFAAWLPRGCRVVAAWLPRGGRVAAAWFSPAVTVPGMHREQGAAGRRAAVLSYTVAGPRSTKLVQYSIGTTVPVR